LCDYGSGTVRVAVVVWQFFFTPFESTIQDDSNGARISIIASIVSEIRAHKQIIPKNTQINNKKPQNEQKNIGSGIASGNK
jgi:hypothetical protein